MIRPPLGQEQSPCHTHKSLCCQRALGCLIGRTPPDRSKSATIDKASIFQALPHFTRIAIIEALRNGEPSTRAIQERLGSSKPISHKHLAILRSRQLVPNSKDGNQVFYSLRNAVVTDVLDIMRRHFQANFAEAAHMLTEIDTEATVR